MSASPQVSHSFDRAEISHLRRYNLKDNSLPNDVLYNDNNKDTVHEFYVQTLWVPGAAILIVQAPDFETCYYIIYKDHIVVSRVCRERSSSLSKIQLKNVKNRQFLNTCHGRTHGRKVASLNI